VVGVSVYLSWSSEPFEDEVVGASAGPWREVRRVEDRVLLVDSDESLSQVYHHLKWSFADVVPTLLVVVCDDLKAKGLPPGTQTWVRARLSRDP
jgi:hypothetical protein